MPVGACFNAISPQRGKRIRDASELLVDLFSDDVRDLINGCPFDETWMYEQLPGRYQHHYDLDFAQQFLDVMIILNWKIHDRRWWMLNSVAEELAMRAVLNVAKAQADLEGKEFDSSDLVDCIFEDTDVEFLFQQEFDGIEDDEHLIKQFRLVNLRFADWFKPFRPTGRIEP